MNKVPNLRFNEFSGEWESLKISETLKIKHGRDQKKIQVEDGIYPILATGGEIGRTNIPLYDKESVLIGRKGTIDKPIYMNSPFWTVDTLFYSEIKNNMVPKFIFYKFQNINWRKYCEASGVPSLSASTIEGIRYNVPQKQEQEKIASFFSLIDKKIELQTEKVEQLKNYKKGIMQKMFPRNGEIVPELRFAGFTDAWEQRKFGDMFSERREKTIQENEDTLLSCAIDGIFLNSELFSHFRGSTTVGYLKVKKNDLILSAQNLHLGNANVNLRFECGIISPAYKVFELVQCNPYFVQTWVKKESTKNFFLACTTEGASVCRKNIDWKELNLKKIYVPKLEEQEKIGAYFSNLDNLITLHQCKLDALNEYKKGLLQQMFI